MAERCKSRGCRKAKAPGSSLCHGHKKAKYREDNPIRASFQNLRNNAKRRGKSFSLTFADFESWALSSGYINAETGRRSMNKTIDRIDPSRGYELGNIQVLSLTENCRKRWTDFWASQSRELDPEEIRYLDEQRARETAPDDAREYPDPWEGWGEDDETVPVFLFP